MIFLEKLSEEDLYNLFDFETKNRSYFELSVPSRGDDYYHLPTFLDRNKELLNEQNQKQSFFYLIRNETKEIVGRINLVDIDWKKKVGELGYRIGETHQGQGIASQAVAALIDEAKLLGVESIQSYTTSNNIPSQKVLEKNDFSFTHSGGDKFEFNGEMVHFVYYDRSV